MVLLYLYLYSLAFLWMGSLPDFCVFLAQKKYQDLSAELPCSSHSLSTDTVLVFHCSPALPAYIQDHHSRSEISSAKSLRIVMHKCLGLPSWTCLLLGGWSEFMLHPPLLPININAPQHSCMVLSYFWDLDMSNCYSVFILMYPSALILIIQHS